MKFDEMYEMLMEGVMSLPRRSYQNVFDWVLESYKKVKASDRTQIDKNFIPPKIFPLDLTGTKYEHLQYLNPKVKAFIILRPVQGSSFFHEYDTALGGKDTRGRHGNIYLNVGTEIEDLLNVQIEHEVVHYIQSLIQLHQKKQGYKNPDIGGLAPKQFREVGIDTQGYREGGVRRVKHSRRPVEHYTNLNSAYKHLQKMYHTKLDIKGQENTWKRRKDFFVKKIDEVDVVRMSGRFFEDMRAVKRENPPLYKIFLKQLYKSFVENDSDLDMAAIDKAVEEAS